jgi:Mrp family chromosome partitioning ATPase
MTERRRALDPAAAAAALGAPLLGRFGPERQLRRFPRFADFSSDASPGNELKVLTSSLLISAHRRHIGTLVVSSAHSREGTSVLAANIAAAGDYTGHSVALVDAGTNVASVSAVFGLDESPGLSEVLDGGPLTNSLHRVGYDDARDLLVVPGGVGGWRNEPGRRLSENRRRAWARTFNGDSELTAIVDAPPVNDHPLALQLAGHGALVIVVSPRTSLTDLDVMRNRAEVSDVPVLGFVLNEFRTGKRRSQATRKALRTHRKDRAKQDDQEMALSGGS